ncbi:MAG: 50S ribosomal protein L2 [Nanoarchaeota archaeon]|nr:50S ribosomal protein L2 [Nanoarchaeota archaeon]MBU1030509.1 50S ribosomal protein L2 [Nanoarchaeota archaeon]MBU1850479.1 50S ribosomal protein L2 [Nanoarchaeota archaeon]
MGKNLTQQKRGKASPRYRAPSFRYKGQAKIPSYSKGLISDIIKCSGHSAPLLKMTYEDRTTGFIIAAEGIKVNDEVLIGEQSELSVGNVLPLKKIPEGTSIFCVELTPGDGGKLVRSSGTAARVISRLKNKVIIKLPSKKQKELHPDCRAIIGMVAGSGRTEKPFVKAGNKHKAMKAKNKYWPSVSGTSMNSVDHPFGGSKSSSKGRPTIAPKNAPPGRKVGKLHPRRTGRTKG